MYNMTGATRHIDGRIFSQYPSLDGISSRVLMEFLLPILTEVLSMERPTQFIREMLCLLKGFCIFEKIPSAVESDDIHISNNSVCTMPPSVSIRTVKGFIFSRELSDEPSIAMENGFSHNYTQQVLANMMVQSHH